MRKWLETLSPMDRDCVLQYEYLLGRKLTGCKEYKEIDGQVEDMILDYESRMDFFADYPELCKYRAGQDFIRGDRVRISGDSADLWIRQYNVRVDTEGTVWETPAPLAKKVMVAIDEIDGDRHVMRFVRRSLLKKITEEEI